MREEAEAADLFPNEAENLLSWIPDALEKIKKKILLNSWHMAFLNQRIAQQMPFVNLCLLTKVMLGALAEVA
ncbi:hypothetical protein MASR1M90_04390 [Desulfovibrionales bacterium]